MEFFLGNKATPAGVAGRGLEPGLSAKGAPMRIPAIQEWTALSAPAEQN